MAVHVVADFVARVHAEGFAEPRQGRVLLDKERCLIVTDDRRIEIALTSVFDIGVGNVPVELREYFDDSVTIAAEINGLKQFVVLEAQAESMEKFRSIFFSCVLSGQSILVRHPAARGGKVIHGDYRPGTIQIERGELAISDTVDTVHIRLDAVTEVKTATQSIDGESHHIIAVSYLVDGAVITTHLAPTDGRVAGLLARYMKLKYASMHRDVTQLDLGDLELQALVALASGATDLLGLLPEEADAEAVIETLVAESLVVRKKSGLALTRRGRVAATTHLEAVNG